MGFWRARGAAERARESRAAGSCEKRGKGRPQWAPFDGEGEGESRPQPNTGLRAPRPRGVPLRPRRWPARNTRRQSGGGRRTPPAFALLRARGGPQSGERRPGSKSRRGLGGRGGATPGQGQRRGFKKEAAVRAFIIIIGLSRPADQPFPALR